MGIYHCDCGETLCGESFECEECGRGGGDGTIFCSDCAAACCAPAEEKDSHLIGKDVALLRQCLWGVLTEQSKHAREKSIQSDMITRIIKKVIADPTGVAALLDESEKRPSKKLKKATKPAPTDEVITIE